MNVSSMMRLMPMNNELTVRPNEAKLQAPDMMQAFGDVLERSIQSISQQEQTVHQLTEQFAAGKLNDVHSLVIASEQLNLGLQLTVQVRNKAIEAYQEMMRMQL